VHDGNLDPDLDGFTNWQEFIAGTNPTNAASLLRLESVLVQGTDTVIGFLAVSNHSYTVEFREFVNNGFWQKWQDFPAASSNRTIWFTNGTGAAPSRYYRLVTPRQP
jgi:hypothetical protein